MRELDDVAASFDVITDLEMDVLIEESFIAGIVVPAVFAGVVLLLVSVVSVLVFLIG